MLAVLVNAVVASIFDCEEGYCEPLRLRVAGLHQ